MYSKQYESKQQQKQQLLCHFEGHRSMHTILVVYAQQETSKTMARVLTLSVSRCPEHRALKASRETVSSVLVCPTTNTAAVGYRGASCCLPRQEVTKLREVVGDHGRKSPAPTQQTYNHTGHFFYSLQTGPPHQFVGQAIQSSIHPCPPLT